MNSEQDGQPEKASPQEAQFWKPMEWLLPIFEREGISLHIEPHPDDCIEDGLAAINLIRGINSPDVSFLHCAPHAFRQGGSVVEIPWAAPPAAQAPPRRRRLRPPRESSLHTLSEIRRRSATWPHSW